MVVATLTRRQALATALATPLVSIASAARAQPTPVAITDELIAAAKKEGKVSHYTSDDLTVATNIGKMFEAKYPGITFQLERSGAERNYQRISQEYASAIHAVDVVSTSDLSHFTTWKKANLILPYMVAEAAAWAADARDPDGFYTKQFFTLMVPGYNTRLVKPEDAPKFWTDLLDPKWKGKIVKAHPGYSGTIMTGTFTLARALGWEYFEKLSKQLVMQVQSAIDPPQRVAQGERAVMADSAENSSIRVRDSGAPLALFYPPEGVPVIPVGNAVMAKAPRPNAARLLVHFLLSAQAQQVYVNSGAHSFSPDTRLPANRAPLATTKLLHANPDEVAREAENIKKRYTQYFAI